MIEIRRFHKRSHKEYSEGYPSRVPGEMVLQYRTKTRTSPSMEGLFWTEWIDVPDVYEDAHGE